eukprot:3269865-Prymnesium_polylepis.1
MPQGLFAQHTERLRGCGGVLEAVGSCRARALASKASPKSPGSSPRCRARVASTRAGAAGRG